MDALSKMMESLLLKTYINKAISGDELQRTTSPVSISIARVVDLKNYCQESRKTLKGGQADLEGEWRLFGPKKHFSTTPIDRLQKVFITDLQAPKIHYGTYLLCKTICLGTRQISVELAVEDENGTPILLTIDNYPDLFQGGTDDIDAIFPVDTILAIREPCIRTPHADQDRHGWVRVESPSDVIICGPRSQLLNKTSWSISTPADELRARGVTHFKASRFFAATLAWSHALELEPSSTKLLLNRSMAYLRLGWNNAALHDAKDVMDRDDIDPLSLLQAQYRAGLAAYGLGRYRDATQYLKNAKDPKCSDLLSRCVSRTKEATTGNFDWYRIYCEGLNGSTDIDVAEYVGAIKTSRMSNRGGGRGVCATADVHTGDLLIVSKAFAITYPTQLKDRAEMKNALHVDSKRIPTGASLILGAISAATTRLYGCPEQRDLVYNLFSGSQERLPTTYPPTAPSAILLSPQSTHIDLDINKIDGAVFKNSFQASTVSAPSLGGPSLTNACVTLNTLPSMFNHSCFPNATWRLFGNVMVIRAVKDVKKGEEITLAYISPTGNTRTRADSLREHLSMCDCELCKWDGMDGEAAWKVREEMDAISARSCSSEPELQRLVKRLTDSYSPSGVFVRPHLVFIHDEAMQWYQERLYADMKNVVYLKSFLHHALMALKSAGIRVIDDPLTTQQTGRTEYDLPIAKSPLPVNSATQEQCIFIITQLAAFVVGLRGILSGKRWFRAAFYLHEATIGGGKVLFEKRFKEPAKLQPMHLNLEFRWN